MKAFIKEVSNIRISACTITKNEEKNIARSILSYRDFVDEIIVVDTGSTDDTVKIAGELGATVIPYTWRNDFAAAKNKALEQATGDWIIFLDADEYFNEGCGKRLCEAIKVAEKAGNNCVGCRMINLDLKTGTGFSEIFSIRVLKKGYHYQYAVHEEPAREEPLKILSVDKTWFYLFHTGYTPSIIREKGERNLKIMLDTIDQLAPARQVTYYSYISDSYFILEKYRKSVEYAKKFISNAGRYRITLVGCQTKPYLNIIQSLELLEEDDDLIEKWIARLENKFPGYPDAAYAKARLLIRRRLFRAASGEIEKTIALSKSYQGIEFTTVESDLSVLDYYQGLCREGIFRVPDALSFYVKAITGKDGYLDPSLRLFALIRDMPVDNVNALAASLFVGQKDGRYLSVLGGLMANYLPETLLQCYSSYKTKKGEDSLNANISAFIFAGKKDYVNAARLFSVSCWQTKDKYTPMRGLICALLSGDQTVKDDRLMEYEPQFAYILGLLEKPPGIHYDLKLAADVISEGYKMKETAFAENVVNRIAAEQPSPQKVELAIKLEKRMCFQGALYAIGYAPETTETKYLEAYYLYRLHRFDEAEELLMQAENGGWDSVYIQEIRRSIWEARSPAYQGEAK